MDETPSQSRHYRDYSISPIYALGHAYHGLAGVTSRTPVHGRRGVRALLHQLMTTLAALDLPAATAAAVPLQDLHDRLGRRPRFAGVGAPAVVEIATILPQIEVAVEAELRARSVRHRRSAPVTAATFLRGPRDLLGEVAYGRLSTEARWDLAEACRAIGQHLPTAGVFHLYRVWIGLTAGQVERSPPDLLPVPDPGRDRSVRCTERDAVSVFLAIRRLLEASE